MVDRFHFLFGFVGRAGNQPDRMARAEELEEIGILRALRDLQHIPRAMSCRCVLVDRSLAGCDDEAALDGLLD